MERQSRPWAQAKVGSSGKGVGGEGRRAAGRGADVSACMELHRGEERQNARRAHRRAKLGGQAARESGAGRHTKR